MFDITNKRTLITGATDGIGLAIAKRFCQAGAKVVITGRRDAGKDIAASIGADFVQADVGDVNAIKQMVSQAVDILGGLDVLISNAGMTHDGYIADVTLEDYNRIMDVNLRSHFFAIQQAAKHMQPGSSIILCNSMTAHRGQAGASIYSMSKAAGLSLTKSAALDYAAQGIRVNSVSPGPIKTPLWGDDPSVLPSNEKMGLDVAMSRFGQPDEVTGAFHFLASAESSYMTGADILIDGGQIAGQTSAITDLIFGPLPTE